MTKSSRKKLFGLLRVGVSALLLLLVWRTASSKGDLLEILRRADLLMLFAATAIFAAGQAVAALRLRYILITLHRRIALPALLRAHFIGITFNQVLPTGFGGDIVKILVLRSPGDTGRITRGVLLARGFGLLALLLATVILVPFYGRVLSDTRSFLVIAAIAFMIIVGFVGAVCAVRSRRLLNRLNRPLRALALLLTDVRRFSAPRPFIETVLTSAVIVLTVIVCFTFLGRALGHPVSLLSCLVIVPPIIVSMHLPLSFGGWGVREVGAVALLPLGGFPPETAFLTSVLYGIVILACGLVGLVLWHLPGPSRNPRVAYTTGPS
jgi:uncharacterized membrane protein YbhN (UPF0104 family)